MMESCDEYYKKLRDLKDRCLGSMIGGACGDALGYAVEFESLHSILKRYPGRGISEYEVDNRGLAPISDDTQMSLFTLEGLIEGVKNRAFLIEEYIPYITQAYLNWYATQTEPQHHIEGSKLSDIPELWACRAPGNTCLSALSVLKRKDGTEVQNNFKGCGGIMRIAPISIIANVWTLFTSKEAAILAGSAADITHKHPLSTYASAILGMTLSWIYLDPDKEMNRTEFRDLIRVMFYEVTDWYGATPLFRQLESLIYKALDLAESDVSDTEGIRQLGEGWVAEETLAIAVFSVMRYIDDFEKCIVCSVNHDGDSDSTGAVAGNLIGAILGYKAIPEKFIKNLELAPEIAKMVNDLFPEKCERKLEDYK